MSEGEALMPTDVHTSRSSPASPGQSARRDSLVRLYDQMGDLAKQELLQFAEDLFHEEAGAPNLSGPTLVTPSRPGPGLWDNDRVLFEFQARNGRVACSVSRQALEESGPGRRARRWQLMEAFERLRPRIERIARDKFDAAPETIGILDVSAAELNDHPELATPATALRQEAG